MKLYFAYGANLSLDSMRQRCPRARPVKPVYLRNWRLKFATHATVVPDAGHVVPGALWSITKHCERSLDAFEGYPYYYSKRTVKQDGVKFMLYVMNSPEFGSTYDRYLNILEEGYQDWGLDCSHLDRAAWDTNCINNFKMSA